MDDENGSGGMDIGKLVLAMVVVFLLLPFAEGLMGC